VCRQGRNFKYLPNERDEYGRTLMVCTRCNQKEPKPGQVNWTTAEPARLGPALPLAVRR